MINSQRKILSMTMATYFQSSLTCRRGGLTVTGPSPGKGGVPGSLPRPAAVMRAQGQGDPLRP